MFNNGTLFRYLHWLSCRKSLHWNAWEDQNLTFRQNLTLIDIVLYMLTVLKLNLYSCGRLSKVRELTERSSLRRRRWVKLWDGKYTQLNLPSQSLNLPSQSFTHRLRRRLRKEFSKYSRSVKKEQLQFLIE